MLAAASVAAAGIELMLALGRSFFAKRSLRQDNSGCNGVMIAVLRVILAGSLHLKYIWEQPWPA